MLTVRDGANRGEVARSFLDILAAAHFGKPVRETLESVGCKLEGCAPCAGTFARARPHTAVLNAIVVCFTSM
jgi:hypothetical protein